MGLERGAGWNLYICTVPYRQHGRATKSHFIFKYLMYLEYACLLLNPICKITWIIAGNGGATLFHGWVEELW